MVRRGIIAPALRATRVSTGIPTPHSLKANDLKTGTLITSREER